MLAFHRATQNFRTAPPPGKGLYLILPVLLLVFYPDSPAYAVGIPVTTTADTIDAAGGSCAGISPASLPGPDGQTSLREAICAANNNPGDDTIAVSVAGTFSITRFPGTEENANSTGDFDVTGGLSITGFGPGATIIDGMAQDRVFDLAPISSCSCTISLSGLTIRNGKAFANNSNAGGAIYIGSSTTVNISNSVIESSTSTSLGGAIHLAATSSLTLNNVTVQNNISASSGGGIHAFGSLNITGSFISNNQAESGGALHLAQDNTRTISITNSTFSANRTVTTAGGNADDGGAIYGNTDAVVTISGNTFSSNTCANNGGAFYLQDNLSTGTGTYNLTNNTLSGNRADAGGGGIYIASGNLTLRNVTATQNHSDNNNAGAESGGGLRAAGGTVTLNNTILAENFRGSTTATTDNVSGTTSGGNNLTSGSPLIGLLAGNGGPNLTHALLGGSPAIDAGNNALCPATDQRGVARPFHGICDIGAYELTDTTPPETTITGTPISPTSNRTAVLLFIGTDNITPAGSLTFQCQLDGGGFSACTSARTYINLGDGSHTFQVRATDQFGNTDLTPAATTWIVDATAPDTTISANPADPSNSASASFSFTGSDPGGSGVTGFQCQLDGSSFSTCTSSNTYPSLADGTHSFQVRAIDAAGNADSTPAGFTWVIDTTPPPAPVLVMPANGEKRNKNQPTISGTAEAKSTVTIFLDGVAAGTAPADAAGSWTFPSTSPLGDGPHTVHARATDGVGNAGNNSNTNTFTVDTVAPSVTLSSAASNPSGSTPIPVAVTFSESVSGFAANDISAVNATVSNFAGSGSNYTFDLIPGGIGLVTADIAAGMAQDDAANPNTAATQFRRTFIAPVITLLGNSILIPNSDISPSPADQTDFGNVVLGGGVTHTFTVMNSGSADLNLSGLPPVALSGPAAADFTIVANPATPVISSTSTTFQVRFSPAVAGTRVATVTLVSNDSTRSPYSFAVTGVGISSGPGNNTIYLPLLIQSTVPGANNH